LVEDLKWTATFEWSASTLFVESGEPADASKLETDERASNSSDADARNEDVTGGNSMTGICGKHDASMVALNDV
jgi:hypothetical protein